MYHGFLIGTSELNKPLNSLLKMIESGEIMHEVEERF